MSASYVCLFGSCQRLVKGMLCSAHREVYEAASRQTREARSELMRERWARDREGMLEAIRQGRASAVEGALP